jgi:hypothetical protein
MYSFHLVFVFVRKEHYVYMLTKVKLKYRRFISPQKFGANKK